MKFTVITVCRNAVNEIRETVESVLNQTYPHIEYVIIDGASGDGTLAVLEEYADRGNVRIYSEKDNGIYNAMNRGIARASGDYLFFLNAGDTFYNDSVLESIYPYMKDNTEAIYYGKVCLVFADGSKSIEDFSQWEGSLQKKLLDGLMPCHQSIFAPRKLLTDHYFRETYKIRADYEWLVYTVSKGSVCRNMPVVISDYNTSGVSGKYRNRGLSLQEEKEIIREYEKSFGQDIDLSEQKKESIKWKGLAQKHLFMLELMDQWMALKQKERHIGAYLREKGYSHIAIYGMGSMGQRLYEDLEGAIAVDYGIDQNADRISAKVRLYSPNDKLEAVDAIIVTAIMSFNEIEKKLSAKVTCPILAFEDILYEMTVQETG